MKKICAVFFFLLIACFGYNQCTQAIIAPWLEDFETFTPTMNFVGLNCWSEVSVDSPDWNIDGFGSTPSNDTGPFGAHSGNNFFYLEASTGLQGQKADLISPMINISTLSNPAISFWYHMYGLAMDSLQVWVTDLPSGTSTYVWGVFGQQHASETDAWTQQIITLSGFSDSIQITFRGFKGFSHEGDVSIDDIEVMDCTPTFSTISATSCGYYTAPSGKQLHFPGTYADTISNSVGCDSIITIHLGTHNYYATINSSGCTYMSSSGEVWNTTGTYYDTVPTVAGCDSVLTINFTSFTTTNSFSTTACNTYTAPSGAQYNVSGIYNDTIQNTVGCDSILTITVNVNYNNNLTIFVTTCGDPYISDFGNVYTSTGLYTENYQTVDGCDSILYLDVLISEGNETTVFIEACNEYISDAGVLYDSSGSYDEMFTGATGCDSIITYDVIIHTIDPSISVLGPSTVLTANQSGAIYQWVDCNNNYAPIVDSVNQTFSASINGDYACIVTYNGCSEMSECIRIETTSFEEYGSSESTFNVFPNPSTGLFSLELQQDLSEQTTVNIYSPSGQIIYSDIIITSLKEIDLGGVESGLYYIAVVGDSSKSIRYLIVE